MKPVLVKVNEPGAILMRPCPLLVGKIKKLSQASVRVVGSKVILIGACFSQTSPRYVFSGLRLASAPPYPAPSLINR
ncbi:hypothetical protein D3C85_1136360 [compost metagenome]